MVRVQARVTARQRCLEKYTKVGLVKDRLRKSHNIAGDKISPNMLRREQDAILRRQGEQPTLQATSESYPPDLDFPKIP